MDKSKKGKGWRKNVSIIYLILIFDSPFNIKLVKVGTKFHINILSGLCTKNIFDIFSLYFPQYKIIEIIYQSAFCHLQRKTICTRRYLLLTWSQEYSLDTLIQGVLSIYHIIYIRAHIMSARTQYLTKWVQIMTHDMQF